MRKVIGSKNYLRNGLGFLLLLGFISLGAMGGCNNNNATAQGDDEIQVDFLVDLVSGSVEENPDGEGFILGLEVSPITVFIEERPGFRSGISDSRLFFLNFDERTGGESVNAILAITEGGSTTAAAVTLNSVQFDSVELTAEIAVTPMDIVTDPSPMGISAELVEVQDLDSSFGRALLFIDATKVTLPFPNRTPPPPMCDAPTLHPIFGGCPCVPPTTCFISSDSPLICCQ